MVRLPADATACRVTRTVQSRTDVPPRLPKPFADLRRGRQRLRFFHGDSLDILGRLSPALG